MNKELPNINNSFFSNDTKENYFSQFCNKELLLKKTKAASTHLLLSILLIFIFFFFAINYWFPNDILALTGIKEILIMILLIDIIIGPLLTFLVFNPIKKSLKFDLSSILAIQLTMFFYGVYTVYTAHPVYITFTVDRFTLVSARDANPSKALLTEYKVSKLSRPILAYTESPKDTEKQQELLFGSVEGGLDLEAFSEYYQPYKENINKIIKRGWNPDSIFNTAKSKKALSTFLNSNKITLDDVVFIPVEGKSKFMTYGVDKSTANPIHAFDIDPWEALKK